MPGRWKVIALDLDPASLVTLQGALPDWEIEVVNGAARGSWMHGGQSSGADLLVVGVREDATEALGLCRTLRNQAMPAATPLLLLVPPGEAALVRAALEAGADSCLALPLHAKEVASMVARARDGNRPGRHTLGCEQAQREDPWRDDGGQG